MPGKRTNWSEANIKDYNALYNLIFEKRAKSIDAHKFDYKVLQRSADQAHLNK